MRVIVAGNCATSFYTMGVRALFPNWDVRGVLLDTACEWLASGTNPQFDGFLRRADMFLGLRCPETAVWERIPERAERVIIPVFAFRGLHPDSFHLANHRSVLGAGTLSSRIACTAHRLGLSPADALAAFTETVYERLGYFAAFESERSSLIAAFAAESIEVSALFERWASSGKFLYTYNHPKGYVLADLLVAALSTRTQLPTDARGRLDGVEDQLAHSIEWPIYPEIGQRHGVSDRFVWRKGANLGHEELDLETFVAATYESLDLQHERDAVIPDFERAAAAIDVVTHR